MTGGLYRLVGARLSLHASASFAAAKADGSAANLPAVPATAAARSWSEVGRRWDGAPADTRRRRA